VTPLSTLFASIEHHGEECHVHIPPDWQQGRTTYGGLTAALCVEAAHRTVPHLPPLRSAQFTFAGPAGGDVRMATTILRRGKSTVFVSVDLTGSHGLATHATLSFAAQRQTTQTYRNLPMPPVPTPEQCGEFFGTHGPTFSQHFDYRNAGGAMPMSGTKNPEYLIWLRHRDENAGTGAAALVALADAPPPAAMAMFAASAPISTMTWSLDLFDAHESGAAPWRLIRSTADLVDHGYSSQAMALWTAQGEPLLIARQNVAIFQ
jgi:acyl-CoA thioesterase